MQKTRKQKKYTNCQYSTLKDPQKTLVAQDELANWSRAVIIIK